VATMTTTPALSAEQIQELLALSAEADSVELKLTVPESHQVSTIQGLGLDPLEAQIRQVFFFDTPDLALDSQGVVVRARRIQGKGNDSIVKLRPVVPHELPEELRASGSFRVEVDALPGGFVCSGTMKGTPPDVLGSVRGKRPLRQLRHLPRASRNLRCHVRSAKSIVGDLSHWTAVRRAAFDRRTARQAG